MMKKLSGVLLILVVGISGLALVASAGGTSAHGSKLRRLHVSHLEALALDGNRVAYDVARSRRHRNRVLVWDLLTGKTINMSGRQGTSVDSTKPVVGLTGLAIAGPRVAWLTTSRFASQGEDTLYTSSLPRPTVRRAVREVRKSINCGRMIHGPFACAGDYLRGLVGAGNLVVVNRWTVPPYSMPPYDVTNPGLYALRGTKLTTLATGGNTIEAVDIDHGRVVVLRDAEVYAEESVGLYSSTGAPPISVTPTSYPTGVALSGSNLVVFEGPKLALYDAGSGRLRKTFTLHGNPATGDVQGNIAAYSAGRSIRALNLSNGKDRMVGRLAHPVTVTRIDSLGLVYASNTAIVFLPSKQVAAAVS
jgi:hypothetical protein